MSEQKPQPAGQIPGANPTLLGEIQSEVAVEAAPLLTLIVTHMKLVVGSILVLLLATLGYGVWQWQESKALHESQLALGTILLREAGQERVKALEDFAAKAPADMRQAVLLELAASSVAAGDYARAAEAYGELVAAEPTSATGTVAALNQADLLQRTQKPAEAVTVLEKLLAIAPEALRPTVREQLAGAAVQAGDFKKALTAYEELLQAESALPNGTNGVSNASANTAFFKDRVDALKKQLASK